MYQIYFIWSNTLQVSDGLSVHYQEFKTVHTATCICQTEIPEMDKITEIPEMGKITHLWNFSLTNACCCMYSLELLMMDGKTVRNMYSVTPNKINLTHWCI